MFIKLIALLIFVLMLGVGIGLAIAALLSAGKCADCLDLRD